MKTLPTLLMCGLLTHAVYAETDANSETQPATGDPSPAPALQKAEHIDLDQPIEKLPEAATTDIEPTATDAPNDPASEQPIAEQAPETNTEKDDPAEDDIGSPFVLLGTEVPARTATRLAWSPSQSIEGIAGSTPVLVVNGKEPGPVLCLTAAIHGDELNGIEIVRRVMYDVEPEKLKGTMVGVPIVNLQGFHRNSRYLTDRRDLNRFFPGNPEGSLASRIAYSFYNEVISHCDALVDLHTGSFHRTNLPQLRADLQNEAVVELSQGLGSTVVLHSSGGKGTLRYAANMDGIPTVTLEAGGPMRLQEKEVAHGVKAIQTLMNKMGMYKRQRFWGKPEPVFYESKWVRADQGGILFSEVFLGKRVKQGDLLGTITDPVTNTRNEVRSPARGRVLGMAINQVVMPGFAAFRIGIERDEDEFRGVPLEDTLEGQDSSGAKAEADLELAAEPTVSSDTIRAE